MANWVGSKNADTYNGTGNSDTIEGLGGADILDGKNGGDTYIFNAGDVVAGEKITDTGNQGTDTIELANGDDVDFRPAVISGIEALDFVNTTFHTQTATFNASQLPTDLQIDGSTGALELVIEGASNFSAAGFTFNQFNWDDSIDKVVITGTSSGDTITGSNEVDIINGADGNDTLNGGAGNDTITGGRGNDTIDGGAGSSDTAVYSGKQSQYQITWIDENTLEVVDTRSGANVDGTDVLTNVERLSFTDGDINVSSINRPPKAVADTASVIEDSTVSKISFLSGLLGNDSDPDGNPISLSGVMPGTSGALTSVGSGAGTTVKSSFGTLVVKNDGTYTYTADQSAADALPAGQTAQDVFTYEVRDNKGGSARTTVTFTITGVNDTATVTGATTGAVTEDAVVSTATGKLTVSDADTGQSFAQAFTSAGTYGTFSVTKDGDWSYALDNSKAIVQGLAAGVQKTETFTVTSQDGSASKSVTITITGANDTPTFSPNTTATIVEDASPNTVGDKITIEDKDANQSSFQAVTDKAGSYGKLTLKTDGTWTYTLDNTKVQSLAEGVTATDTFTVKSADNTPLDIVVTVKGVNDPATLSGEFTGALTEDSNTTKAKGTISVSDADAGQAAVKASTQTSAYGDFNISSDGKWTFDINKDASAVQSLGAGKTAKVDFAVSSLDNSATKNVTITITGVNDEAKITGTSTGSVTEDAADNTAKGTLSVVDADTGESTFKAIDSKQGAYGTFSLGTDGAWTYTLDNSIAAVQQLGGSESKTETFQVETADGTTASVTVTVKGANDPATISGSFSGDVAEDGTTLAKGTVTVSDVDAGQSEIQAQNTKGDYGTFKIGTDGKWTYDLANQTAAVQGLKGGEKVYDTFTIVSKDNGSQQSVKITVTGENDVAKVTGKDTGSVTEDTAGTTSGNLNVNDTDNGESTFKAVSEATATYGTYTIGTDGKWTYTLDDANAAVNALGDGGKLTDTFTVSTVDGTTHDVTVTIKGTNDAPTLGEIPNQTTAEDTPITATAEEVATLFSSLVKDVDSETVTVSFKLTYPDSSTETIVVDPTKAFTYTPPKDFFGNVQVEVLASDGSKSATTTFTLTVTPVNDAPVIGNIPDQTTAEDTPITATASEVASLLKSLVTDIDSKVVTVTLTLTYPKGSGIPEEVITVDASKDFTYTPPSNFHGDVGVLVTANDGELQATKTFTLKVTSVEDPTQFEGTTSGTVAEDLVFLATGKLSGFDPDTQSSAPFQLIGVDGAPIGKAQYGTYRIDAAGNWSYSLDNANSFVQQLKLGESLEDSFIVKAQDGTEQVISILINGTDEVEGGPGGTPITNSPFDGIPSDGRSLNLKGGAGIDTAVLPGQHSAYTIKTDASGLPATFSAGSSSGTMSGIERIAFSDGVYAYDTNGNAGQVYRLYKAAFDRTPDTSGLTHNIQSMDKGAALKDIAASFVASQEFATVNGANLSDTGFITALYNNVLDRAPDAAGLSGWLLKLSQGMSRAEVLIGFSESAENKAAVAGAIKDGILLGTDPSQSQGTFDDLPAGTKVQSVYGGKLVDYVAFTGAHTSYSVSASSNGTVVLTGAEGTKAVSSIERAVFSDAVLAFDNSAKSVYRLYEAAFDREPDEAGLTTNLGFLDKGVSLHDLAQAFINSTEFKNLVGASPTDTQFVTALYKNVLGRAPDSTGLSDWLSKLSSHTLDRADVLVGFSESAENQSNTAIATKAGILLDLGILV